MYYILYNKEAKGKKVLKVANKLFNRYSKLDDCYMIDLDDIENQEAAFISECKNDDTLVICGGDGTVDVFFNKIQDIAYKCKILVYPCGEGNDLARDYRGKPFDITTFSRRLPKVVFNGKELSRFVNGVGIGIDVVVCRTKEQYKFADIKKSYFSISAEAMKTFRTFNLDIIIDDGEKHFDDVWLCVVNSGRYMGGGMKVTPLADRNDDLLDLCIVYGLSRRKIYFIFPFIYFGLHVLFKKHVYTCKAKSFVIKPESVHSIQRDGEVFDGIIQLDVKAE